MLTLSSGGARRPPIVLDIGSNHGLYALYAAPLGASVVVLEPQNHLCRLINHAASLNGPAVAARIRLFNAAALDARERISLSQAEVRSLPFLVVPVPFHCFFTALP